MRIVLAGALGEVGGALQRALIHRGHTLLPVSSRAPLDDHPDALGLAQARDLVREGSVDALVNAGGPGDHRSRPDEVSEWSESLLDACNGIPAILISTTRVLEGHEANPQEDAPGEPLTPYARANTEHEELWLKGSQSVVLRLVNFFCAPSSPSAPQAQLLPWSLLVEGWQIGQISVRASGATSKEFVDAHDVARAVEALIADNPTSKTFVAGPGVSASLAELAEASVTACEVAGRTGVEVSFGNEPASVNWSIQPGWLVAHGWASELTVERMSQEMSRWLVQWGSVIPQTAREGR